MKTLLIVLLSIVIHSIGYAQIFQDSLAHQIVSVSQGLQIDSIGNRLQSLPDSLPSLQKIDSIRTTFVLAADSIHAEYHKAVDQIDGQLLKANKTIDSLQRLQLPTDRYTKHLDSLSDLRERTASKLKSRLDTLKAKTTDKLKSLPPEYREPLQELTAHVDKMSIDADVIKIPELKVSGYTLPEIKGIGDLTSKTGEISKLAEVGKVPEIETPVGDLGKVTQHAKGYQEDLQRISEGNLNDVQAVPETIEQQAAKVNSMDELQKQSAVIDQHKTQVQELNDPDKAKKKAVEVAKKAATDHFAGKQEQLKAAMEKVSKYKQKYSSVSSIKDLPKRPPNPMKGKPFVDRIVPGLYLQYQLINFCLADVNPYVGYKLSARFTAGLGWNQRYAYDKDQSSFDSRSRIFGPRAYADFKLGRGFIAHIEGESMNSFVPSTLRGNPDAGHREWVWGMMTGIKKEYRIYKNLKGTALIQYNLFDRYYKAPYGDRLNSRIGFEYVLKKKRKKGK